MFCLESQPNRSATLLVFGVKPQLILDDNPNSSNSNCRNTTIYGGSDRPSLIFAKMVKIRVVWLV